MSQFTPTTSVLGRRQVLNSESKRPYVKERTYEPYASAKAIFQKEGRENNPKLVWKITYNKEVDF